LRWRRQRIKIWKMSAELLNAVRALPPIERIELIEEIWNSLDANFPPSSEDEIRFARQRLQDHHDNPNDFVTLEEVKARFAKK
jgi:putative addiction module component (TIGR02574 family)